MIDQYAIPKDAKTFSGYDVEHLFWLVAREAVFFHTWDESEHQWDGGWHVAINSSDTFLYACADATEIAPGQEGEVRIYFDRYGWAGLVAWAAYQRGEDPLPSLKDSNYHEAMNQLEVCYGFKHLKDYRIKKCAT
jgi:hypothetical protein